MTAICITRARQLAPIISLQAYYSPLGRDIEREITPLLASGQVGLLVWNPLAGGYVTGKYSGDGGAAERQRHHPRPRCRLADRLGSLRLCAPPVHMVDEGAQLRRHVLPLGEIQVEPREGRQEILQKRHQRAAF